MTRNFNRNFLKISALSLGITVAGQVTGQQIDDMSSNNDSSIVYRASFFADFSPVNVSDMINRIPGINIAMQFRGGSNNR